MGVSVTYIRVNGFIISKNTNSFRPMFSLFLNPKSKILPSLLIYASQNSKSIKSKAIYSQQMKKLEELK